MNYQEGQTECFITPEDAGDDALLGLGCGVGGERMLGRRPSCWPRGGSRETDAALSARVNRHGMRSRRRGVGPAGDHAESTMGRGAHGHGRDIKVCPST
ncbi:hypothetical protein E2562_011367 [Oryza meyeriana var. granulata]|uniref:Uncharacterized protein n=1 Tax=Oryza meyeriana var. granulata TaxID=110450 RepID=A0A6G1E932_9ORYZ|nr:hypothetical protein E2562_011367 [Oryza meyeriana var. granulata]